MHNTQIKRITKAKQFSYIKKNGNKLVYPPFIILFVKEKSLDFFCGVIVSSKVGNAVIRNKVKRRLRNISMSVLKEMNAHGFSICIIARPSAYKYKFDKMKDLFANAVKKITI